MPWSVVKGGGNCAASKFAVVNKQTGKTMGCHDTRASANKQLAALNANVKETGDAMQELTEARASAGAVAVKGKPGRFLIQLITPGWGSSGYYGPDVLAAAAESKVFPAGTHMYIDHPTESEAHERPQRTIRDLAAELAEDAHWDGSALVAEANVFERDRAPLDEMKDAIGVSIRASAEVDHGEAEGRRGTIVQRLVEGISADFVTHAGQGRPDHPGDGVGHPCAGRREGSQPRRRGGHSQRAPRATSRGVEGSVWGGEVVDMGA
jgi:hypothetical protein